MNRPLVIDIYRGDSVTSFQEVKDSGIVGVIHKSSEGKTLVDSTYAARRRAFVGVGMLWGAYHFYHGGGAAEADFFLRVAEPDQNTLVALDWETSPAGSTPSAASAKAFLERVHEKLGRKAVVYSGNVAKEHVDGNDAYFGSHRLWLAQYGTHWSVQESWRAPWLWQNNGDNWGPGPHRIPGIGTLCDNNTVVDPMTVQDLVRTWSGGVTHDPGPVDPPVTHDTEWLQKKLNELGADPQLLVDGKYGPRTRSAVKAFQAKHGLRVDGTAGPITIAKIEELST